MAARRRSSITRRSGDGRPALKISKKVFTQNGTGKDAIYGHKILIDLPMNKGRTMGAFYFVNGKLYALEATMPPNSNYASPGPDRFVDSIKFTLSRTEPGAVELITPKP